MKLKIFYFFLILTLTSIISSCGKSAESKIIGTWNKISVGPDKNIGTWTFTADHHLYINRIRITLNDDTLGIEQDTATWNINLHTLRKNTLKIDQTNTQNSNIFPFTAGEFEIRELNDILVLQRVKLSNGETDGAYAWHEFEKTK